jgi:3-dehydroquinate dehydratase-2
MTDGAAAARTILVLSGPNLNLLGAREPDVYGDMTLDAHVAAAVAVAEGGGYAVEHVQANDEGTLVDAVQAARTRRVAAIVVNPGAVSHYGWSLHDALAAFDGVVVEVHLSNTARRERWRHVSVVSPVSDATLVGLGPHAYAMGMDAALRLLADRTH